MTVFNVTSLQQHMTHAESSTHPATQASADREAASETGANPVQLATRSAVEGLPSQDDVIGKGKGRVGAMPAKVQTTPRRMSRDELLSRMQQRYKEEQHKFDVISPGKKPDAEALHTAYQELSTALKRDAASVKQQDIDKVMAMAERYFDVDWKRDARLSGYMYQWVSHPAALMGALGPALFSNSKAVPKELVSGGLAAQIAYTIGAFALTAVAHSIVFQAQFRTAKVSAKTTSDSVKTPTLAAALQELREAKAELQRSINGSRTAQPEAALQELHEATGNFEQAAERLGTAGPSDQNALREHVDAYRRVLNARANCAKIQGKFNVEQMALFWTSLVRAARAVTGTAATLTGFFTGNARNGLITYVSGTAAAMLAQIFAGLPDTANKASAQNRLMPRAVDVLAEAERERARRADASARATHENPDAILPASAQTGLQTAKPADSYNADDELNIFISTLYKNSLLPPLGMRVNLLERKFDFEKRKAMQTISALYNMPKPDSYQRMTYLSAKRAEKPADFSEQEQGELTALEGLSSKTLPAAEQTKLRACLATIERVNKDIAHLKKPEWSALSEPGLTALEKELRALVELERYRNASDILHLAPTLWLAVRDGLSDLLKPEQVGPLSVNKLVQMTTMIFAGPAIPQLTSGAMAEAKVLLGNTLPMWVVTIPLVVLVLGLYGSQFGPRAATHTVQIRSDRKRMQATGELGIPAGGRMCLSWQFWKEFFKNVPGAVMAQAAIDWQMYRLGKEYARSEQLLAADTQMTEFRAIEDAEAGQLTVLAAGGLAAGRSA